MAVSDADLLKRIQQADRDAFAVLFDRHSPAILRYAYTLTGELHEAQDLLQETFLTAWRRAPSIHLAADSVLPWLLVTCRYHGANASRRRAVRATVPLEPALEGRAWRSTADDAGNREELAWVVEAVSDLGEMDRRIVELCLFNGFGYGEAAARLGLSVGAVAKRVQRVRDRLRAQRATLESEV